MGAGAPSDPLGGGDDLDAMADINVTPLVDVMLVLLIIFMVAAPLMLTGVPVDLPKTAAAKQNPPQKPLVVTLTRELAVHIRDEPVSREELAARLAAVRAAEGDAVAYVRADKAVPHGEVMATLGAIASAGYARISLLAQPAAGSTQISNTH